MEHRSWRDTLLFRLFGEARHAIYFFYAGSRNHAQGSTELKTKAAIDFLLFHNSMKIRIL